MGSALKYNIFISFMCFSLLLIYGCGRPNAAYQAGPPEVSAVKIIPQQLVLTTELPGRVSAYRIAEVRPQVSGIIQKRFFTEGTNVKAGDILYQIDPAPFKATYDNAKSALERAQANLPAIKQKYERYKELIVHKAISEQEFDDVQAAYKQAEADVNYWKATYETAQINLGYTKVTAPISGRIGKSNVTEGALVTANQPTALTTIQQLDPVYIDIPQSTAELMELQKKLEEGKIKYAGKDQSKVRLVLEDGTIYQKEGILQFRDVTVDPTTGSVIIRATFPNERERLLPGMFVRAIVTEGVNKNAIMIPQQSVMYDPKGKPFVFIVDREGKAQIRPIQLDRAIGNKWLISSGLASGDTVIVEGLQRLKPGVPVKATDFKEDAKLEDTQIKDTHSVKHNPNKKTK
ncbi:MAG TPA: efflux RND transporter periplasmic adaptor subunit [Syntrophorhabdaceae bacterium]|nr:efflux RND transporter periplasmic adaptor subunit [Syntrophorhabdaceae bacterium]